LNDYYVPANLLPISGEEIDMPEPMPPKPEDDIEDDIENDLEDDINKMLVKYEVVGKPDYFSTIEEAEERANELGGSGHHEADIDGETFYMPFDSHEEYQEVMRNNKAEVSARVEKALKKKVADHNASVNAASKKTSLSTLKKVFVRGIGAFNTNPDSVRPSVSNADQWAMARVNSFLYALKNGKFRSGKHDTDLLPEDHPMSSKKEQKQEGYDDYPQSATNNAKRMIEWREKYGRDEVKGGTAVGWQRASQLANREKLSAETVGRMAAFNRHRKNATVDPKYKDEPWKDNGYVAWNLWGGTSGVNWAIKKMESIRNNE
jgi:hypothetical protein